MLQRIVGTNGWKINILTVHKTVVDTTVVGNRSRLAVIVCDNSSFL